MGELKTELKLCSQRVAQLGLKDAAAMAVRDIAYGVNTGQLEVVNGGIALLAPSTDEQELLVLFRAASLTAKAAAIGALQGAAAATPPKRATPKPKPAPNSIQVGNMTNHAAGSVQVGYAGGKVTSKVITKVKKPKE